MAFKRITEKDSNYNNLEVKSIPELLENIHAEDLFAVKAVSKSLTQIKNLISSLEGKLKNNTLPYVVCSKDVCGCGLCAPKSLYKDKFKEIFSKYSNYVEA